MISPSDINALLIPKLETYRSGLMSLEERLFNIMQGYESNHASWLMENDFRPGIFSRLISDVVASRFATDKVLEYLQTPDWELDFKKNYMPAPWQKVNYYGHMKEIALLIRFHIIHSVYSQIEATHRIIIRSLNLSTSTKPATAVNTITHSYPEDDIRFLDFIRNSIHNNGHHYPDNPRYNIWKFSFRSKEFNFTLGGRIDLEFNDIINIIADQIDKIETTLNHPQIVAIQITQDAT